MHEISSILLGALSTFLITNGFININEDIYSRFGPLLLTTLVWLYSSTFVRIHHASLVFTYVA